ncbi:hypothetical protein V3C99_003387 [Haemonchus contortus]
MGLGSPQNGQARQCHRRLLLFNKADSLGRSVALSSRVVLLFDRLETVEATAKHYHVLAGPYRTVHRNRLLPRSEAPLHFEPTLSQHHYYSTSFKSA